MEGAIKDFDISLGMYPHTMECFFYRGNAKRKIGDEIGAKKDLALTERWNYKPPEEYLSGLDMRLV
jgi:hypothetical protein